MLDERKLNVLKAIVTDFVASEEPVGSKALVEKHNLAVSAATIRNDMAVLEEEGYITQPHTSAGRIPTDKGYRLFVDKLATIKPLSAAEKRAIDRFMVGAVDYDDVLYRTVRLLADITHNIAIVQYPITSAASIRRIELVASGADRFIIIVIKSNGALDQRFVSLPDYGTEALAVMNDRINEAVNGLEISEALGVLDGFADSVAPEYRELGSVVAQTVRDVINSDPTTRVVVAGRSHVTRFNSQISGGIYPILDLLEEQVVLLKLLSEAVSGEEGDVTVRIGQENTYEPLRSTSVVVSGYSSSADTLSGLGIVGPTRMDYPSAISAVRAVARYVGRFLSEG